MYIVSWVTVCYSIILFLKSVIVWVRPQHRRLRQENQEPELVRPCLKKTKDKTKEQQQKFSILKFAT